MEVLLVVCLWTVLVVFAVLAFLISTKERFRKYRDTIRRAWYLVFLVGALIKLTEEPSSLFDDWINYLIVLIVFIIIDYLLLLNLYISKFSGNEFSTVEEQVVETQEMVDISYEKVRVMKNVLNTYAHLKGTNDKNEYIQELEDFINAYAKYESLNVEILPIRTQEEMDDVLDKPLKRNMVRQLELNRNFRSKRDDLELIPLAVLDEKYVAKVTSLQDDVIINSIDGHIVNMMLVVYVLAVNYEANGEDGGLE